jgi:hypothetical protein
LIRMPKPALAVLAGFVLIIASACGSSASTPGAPAASVPAGATAPAGASPAAATLNAQDPESIISQVVTGGSDIKSFHIKLAVTGTIKAAAMASTGGALGGLSGDLKLDGSSIEGDVDVANQAAHLTVALPTMALSGDVILVNNVLYYKLLTPKYTKMDLATLGSSLGALSSSLPVAVPSPGASAMSDLTGQIDQLRTTLQNAGVKATLVGVEQISGKDADHINISIPLDMINAQLAAAASPSPAPKLDSASVDVWIYKDTYRIAQFEAKGASSTLGNLDLTITVSNYDQPVTIAAPSADQIQAAP